MLSGAQLVLGMFQRGHVNERQHHTLDALVLGTVREHTGQVLSAVLCGDLLFN